MEILTIQGKKIYQFSSGLSQVAQSLQKRQTCHENGSFTIPNIDYIVITIYRDVLKDHQNTHDLLSFIISPTTALLSFNFQHKWKKIHVDNSLTLTVP